MEYKQAKVLFSKEKLDERIKVLGAEITRDYKGKDLVVVGILKGSFIFMADLVRAIDLPLQVDFLGLSSYGDETSTSGVVKITNDLSKPIDHKHVLIVEDIIDTGLTMQYLLEFLKTRSPSSVKICALLEKPDNAKTKIDIAYKGFTIPNEFVVGYGLDYAGLYRNLAYIGVLGA
ncbi:MAG: hypoxanthine phosphoribosyltransferase [Deltaproteobacteria bacterium]|nr:hypoxanthine phosphoribosyltransferase [Deltaproteobacteria bacterium]